MTSVLYPAAPFVPRKPSESGANLPFSPDRGLFLSLLAKAHSGSQSETGRRSLLRLFLVILRLVDIFPTIWCRGGTPSIVGRIMALRDFSAAAGLLSQTAHAALEMA